MTASALSMQGHAAWLRGKAGPVIGLSQAALRDKHASPGVRALAVQQPPAERNILGNSMRQYGDGLGIADWRVVSRPDCDQIQTIP